MSVEATAGAPRATDAQIERWAETGTGYSLEVGDGDEVRSSPRDGVASDERVVRVVNGDEVERYCITRAQAERLEQAAQEHGAKTDDGHAD